jgi:hypothetical protein
VSLVGSPLRVIGGSGCHQGKDAPASRRQEDADVATSLGLSDEEVVATSGPSREMVAEDDLFHLGQPDAVTGDVLLAPWLNDKLVDSHGESIFPMLL